MNANEPIARITPRERERERERVPISEKVFHVDDKHWHVVI